MTGQPWPPPAESPRNEEKEAAIQKLVEVYYELCRRQRREHIYFVAGAFAFAALSFTIGAVEKMADLWFACVVVAFVACLAYFVYAGWREMGIFKVRRQIKKDAGTVG